MFLDHKLVKEAHFIRFESPPLLTTEAEDEAAFDEWIDRLQIIETDIKWLLSLSHCQFWSQIVFDKSIQECLDSFLKYAPRPHDGLFTIPIDCEILYKNIYRYFFMIFLRLSTFKESKNDNIDPEIFADIIYSNFIFDIPKLMDLCVLFSANNSNLLERMVKNIFETQPKYFDDLFSVLFTISNIFEDIKNRCFINDFSNNPVKLSEKSSDQYFEEMPVTDFQDIIFYYMDISSTLYHFLNTYSPVAKYFSHDNFHLKLAQTYECVVKVLSDTLKVKTFPVEELKIILTKNLHLAQNYTLRSFRIIIHEAYIQPLLESNAVDNDCDIEDYFSNMFEIVNEKRFLGHLNSIFPIENDLAIFTQADQIIDETRLKFFLDGIKDAASKYSKNPLKVKKENEILADQSTDINVENVECTLDSAESWDGSKNEFDDLPSSQDPHLTSLISSVKDILPDIGDGFIKLCLKEMNYKVENVVQAILEENLPPSLSSLDRTLPSSVVNNISGLIGRQNVYDNDEFDVFTQDYIDTSKVHKGKKDNLGENFLDPKEFVKQNKSRYDPYSIVTCEVNASEYDYDDEYDDTCELLAMRADDADSADELLNARPLTGPRIFDPKKPKPIKYFSSDSSDEESKPKDEFITNPELIRKAREASYQARVANRGVNKRPNAPKKHDVVGAAKGQGQSGTVLKNRNYKSSNKSTMANHSRRYFSDKKRTF